jgi:ribosomal-protein-alanine N-acetyltransferase
VHICRLLPENVAEVIALEHIMEPGWSAGSIYQEIDRPLGLQLVAYGDCVGTAVGWCCGLLVGEEAELLRIGVMPTERRGGVASALLVRFEKECVELGVSSIFLEVARANMAARRLYAKCSYNQVGKRKDYYSHPIDDALVMNKIISKVPGKISIQADYENN